MKAILSILLLFLTAQTATAQSITKALDFKRGAVREVDVAGLNYGLSDVYVVVVRTSNDTLKALTFAGTDRTARASYDAGTATSVSISPGGENRVLVTMRDGDGRLRVISFEVGSDRRTLDRLGTDTGPRIRSVKSSPGASDGEVRLAAKLQDNDLYIWRVTMDTAGLPTISNRQDFGEVKTMDMAGGTFGALVMRVGNDDLRLTTLMSGGNNGIVRGATDRGGKVTDHAIAPLEETQGGQWITFTTSGYVSNPRRFIPSHCINGPIVVHYSPIGRSKLIAWEQNQPSASAEFSRLAEHESSGLEGLAHKVDVVRFVSGSSPRFITG
ncbi:hypothetical protein GCM10007385_23360 [Tateyamaria omphalii]|uniref:hypothetical protein n=1 Tax=Tateyamaria omphalii TaxID=299262 RepID=UPI001675D5F4|nr:hypothetical protein [Tateyamaria omphalii]GGX54444.1 hypothetical protein GCM10007385_23360 [Tateyamaria omphalii]